MPKVVHKLPKEEEAIKRIPAIKPKDGPIKNVTFFGDSSIPEDGTLYKEIRDLAKSLALEGYSIVDGGGPGVMKAATEGAESVGGRTVGVYWQPKLASIFEGKNLANVTDETSTYSNYVMRTLGLIEKGQVYIVCKGGTGTVSEFGMVWALAKLYYGKHKPVILYGDFWKNIIEAIQTGLIIDDNELGVLNYATTIPEVMHLMQLFEAEVETRVHKTYQGDEIAFVLAPKHTHPENEPMIKQEMKEVGAMHRKRVQNMLSERQLKEFASLVQPPARVLEIGVGAGYDLSFLSEKYSVTGVEIDSEMARIASFENPNADIIVMDILDYEVQENTFKGMWARDVLHHLRPEELNELMHKLANGLVPGGILYFIVREGEGEGMEVDVQGGEEIKRYYHYFSEGLVRQLAHQENLEVVKIEKVERSHKWLGVVLRKREDDL